MTTPQRIRSRVKLHFEQYLREFVYGGIDGAVTTFAIVAGATGASLSTTVVLVLGFANLAADGFSMGVGSYLSTKSERELMAKRGEATATEASSPVVNGLATFASFGLVGLVPLLAYVFDLALGLELASPFLIACLLTTAAFIGIGYLKSRVARTPMPRAIFETLALGVIAATLAYVLGDLLTRLLTN